ncbi:CDC42 small effector 2 protein [Danaus plexippus plexippus]|uniref:CDC42 small effector 2 protein n=1 Tax=Danaus plexippus plexippus TaxID=278856 RepID=A0A212EUD0_DANPL|nr:CDC42 small effector 2 protein [Danaus plexippus plexippus]
MATTGSEMWLQWFACCYQPAAQAQRTRRRIDRSMIGEPTNFQHTGHIGSSEVEMPSSLLHSIQNQMQSKGGYEMAYGVKVPHTIIITVFKKKNQELFSLYFYNSFLNQLRNKII